MRRGQTVALEGRSTRLASCSAALAAGESSRHNTHLSAHDAGGRGGSPSSRLSSQQTTSTMEGVMYLPGCQTAEVLPEQSHATARLAVHTEAQQPEE